MTEIIRVALRRLLAFLFDSLPLRYRPPLHAPITTTVLIQGAGWREGRVRPVARAQHRGHHRCSARPSTDRLEHDLDGLLDANREDAALRLLPLFVAALESWSGDAPVEMSRSTDAASADSSKWHMTYYCVPPAPGRPCGIGTFTIDT